MKRMFLNTLYGEEERVINKETNIIFRPVSIDYFVVKERISKENFLKRTKYKPNRVFAIMQENKELYKDEYHLGITKHNLIDKKYIKSEWCENFMLITDVDIIRLQDITEEDCLRSYIRKVYNPYLKIYDGYEYINHRLESGVSEPFQNPIDAFAEMWNLWMKYAIYWWIENPPVFKINIQLLSKSELGHLLW